MLEGITVDYYGAKTPLNQLASLGAPEPRLLVIQPYDRSAVNDIERAILQSDLGLVPQNDGKLIRVPIPELTEERRRDLVKVVRNRAEESRVAVRNIRRDTRHQLEAFEKDGDISRDDLDRAEKDLEKRTHEVVAEIDELLKHKEQELLSI